MTKKHAQYEAMQLRWQKCRDAAADEYTIHSKTTTYLPKLQDETDSSYLTRLNMSPWFGATWRTISGLKGMMFRKPPQITAPESMQEYVDNIDNSGTSLTSYLQRLSTEALTVGRSGTLVEYTKIENAATMADASSLNPRAYFTFYVAETILNWHETVINGRKILDFVRLSIDPDRELKDNESMNLILELKDGKYQQRKVIIDGKGNEVQVDLSMPLMNNKPLNYIPFQIIGTDSLAIDVEIPPLIDLINLNFHHYRQSSSYERGCFLSGLPTACVYGNQDPDKVIYLGGATANSFENPQARMEYVEVKSDFSALLKNLEMKEHQMAVIGARMLERQNKGVESAEALARKQSGEESILADIATTISEGATRLLRILADWQGIESKDIRADLNKEFLPFAMDSAMITALMSAHIQGGLSYDALYYNFDKAGMYPPGSSKEAEQNAINENTGI